MYYRMKIYRKFVNSEIKGFAVVARATDKVVNAKLIAGGVSYSHLMVLVDCNTIRLNA
jgi:hypothetical protein